MPDSTILADYLLAKTTWLVDGLVVDANHMRENLELTHGMVFSGQLLLDLSAAGMLREDAYRLVQGHAMAAWKDGGDFRAMVMADNRVRKVLSPEQLTRIFSASNQLRNIDSIFARVFRQV